MILTLERLDEKLHFSIDNDKNLCVYAERSYEHGIEKETVVFKFTNCELKVLQNYLITMI
jgi:hypothetical protein